MNIPRQASPRFLVALAAAFLAAALPLTASAQNAPAKKQSSNGKIAFMSSPGGGEIVYDIYVMDADGKRQTRLTDDPADDALPMWSPQGDRIAFLSDRRVNDEIYLMNADGSNQHPLRAASPVTVSTSGLAFEWSPDGTRLAYAAGGNIYLIEVDGTAPAVSISDGKAVGSSDLEASWSPDGGRLVIRNDLDNCPTGGCTDLYTVNANGSGRAPLVTAPGFDTSARWSPDGSLIAYIANRGVPGLYVIDSAGIGSEQRISDDVALGPPVWAPDGSRLAFRSSVGHVYAVNADGSGLMLLSDAQSAGGELFWSPDCSKLGFHNTSANGYNDIFVVGSDGSKRNATNLTKSKNVDDFGYSWQKLSSQ